MEGAGTDEVLCVQRLQRVCIGDYKSGEEEEEEEEGDDDDESFNAQAGREGVPVWVV